MRHRDPYHGADRGERQEARGEGPRRRRASAEEPETCSGRGRYRENQAYSHQRRIRIRHALSKRIVIEMKINSSTQFGTSANSSLVWTGLKSVKGVTHIHPVQMLPGNAEEPEISRGRGKHMVRREILECVPPPNKH